MFKHPFQKLVGSKATVPTYDLIRFQAKTHRALKNHLSVHLSKEHLSTLDWSVLGILFSKPHGCRYNEIARELTVEAPFVTELVSKLEAQKLLTSKDDLKDKRAKVVILTKKGEAKVQELEKKLQSYSAALFRDITPSEFETFETVMKKLLEGADKIHSQR